MNEIRALALFFRNLRIFELPIWCFSRMSNIVFQSNFYGSPFIINPTCWLTYQISVQNKVDLSDTQYFSYKEYIIRVL